MGRAPVKRSMGILETIAGWLKTHDVTPRLMVFMAILSGALFLLPDRILARFAVNGLVASHRPVIGGVFFISLVVTVLYSIEGGGQILNRCILRIRSSSARKKRLQNLDDRERQILGSFLLREARTLTFDSEDGAVENLVVCGFLYHPVSEADIRYVPATIDEWTWEYLHEPREAAGLPRK